ncbi:MAG: hypothetical protein GQ524_01950 [Anaerolineales bacterium]|nr:hypothetical protein [Anaerolineales bacterium]
MSINDPILLAYSEKWGYYLLRGRETFYDKNRALVIFDTREEAIAWSEKHLEQTPIEIQSEEEREAILERTWKNRRQQMKLL